MNIPKFSRPNPASSGGQVLDLVRVEVHLRVKHVLDHAPEPDDLAVHQGMRGDGVQ